MAVAGATIGGAAAAAAARLLSSIPFDTPPSDPITFGAAASLLIATTMTACYLLAPSP